MLTRGKLADQTGCHIETIRYYEKVGLLPEPDRTPAGYRIYDDGHLRVLNFIQCAKSLGFSSKQIKELLELSDLQKKRSRADVKSLTEQHIGKVSRKIEDLQQLKKRLIELSSFCDGSDGSTETCPILISLFKDQQSQV